MSNRFCSDAFFRTNLSARTNAFVCFAKGFLLVCMLCMARRILL